MKIHKCIPCFSVKHDYASGGWYVEPTFVAELNQLNIIRKITNGFLIVVEAQDSVDALATAFSILEKTADL